MNDGTAAIIIISLSLAIGIFVGAAFPAIYGWGTLFLCLGVFTLFYTLIKAARWR